MSKSLLTVYKNANLQLKFWANIKLMLFSRKELGESRSVTRSCRTVTSRQPPSYFTSI